MDNIDTQLQQAAELLRGAQRVVVLTGAGVSAESGIPTFREALTGLWAQYDPTMLATPIAFQRDPKLVWDFYEFRRELMRPAQPNPGHYALAELERLKPGLRIITQNVDDLHERAGSHHIIRLHGRINANKCVKGCQGEPTLIDVSKLDYDDVPRCPFCDAYVRPDVVWFGEMLPADALNSAIAASQDADLMLVVGTSGVVTPAADMPVYAKQSGARVVEINPTESAITSIVDVWVPAPSGEALPRLLDLIRDAG